MARKYTQDDHDDANAGDGEGKSSSTMLIAVIAGGALLLCCTCGGVGTGGWFLRDKLGFGGQANKDGDAKKDQVAKDGDKDGKKDDNKPPEKPAPVEKRKADFVTTAEAFYLEFDNKDNAGAQAKYAGKIVEVTGDVQSVRDRKMIFLVGDKRFNTGKGLGTRNISCDILPDFEDVSNNLARDQKVKVVGKFKRASFFQVQLADCSVVALEQANVPRVRIEDLTREHEQNFQAAKQKYDFMDMILTGTVESVGVLADGSGYALMKSATKMRVKLLGGPVEMKQLRAGAQVEIRPMPALTGMLNKELMITIKSIVKVQ